MSIVMKSSRFRVLNVLKKTQANIFKDIKAGDIVQFSTSLINSYGTATIKMEIYSDDEEIKSVDKTARQLTSILACFNLEEMN